MPTIHNPKLKRIPQAVSEPGVNTARRAARDSGAHSAPLLASSDELIARLPNDANAIDRAIFEQLALVWKEEAPAWTEEMRESLLRSLPEARITRSTGTPPSHATIRKLRRDAAVPSWGQFVVLRTMFGAAACFRELWGKELAVRHPVARDDAYEGVVPARIQAVRDVLDGKAGLPQASHRKVSYLTLRPEVVRVRKRKSGTGGRIASMMKKSEEEETDEHDTRSETENEGKGLALQRGKQQEQKQKQQRKRKSDVEGEGEKPCGAEMLAVSDSADEEAATNAGNMERNNMIAIAQTRYSDQEEEIRRRQEQIGHLQEQIRRLQASNALIRSTLPKFEAMPAKSRGE